MTGIVVMKIPEHEKPDSSLLSHISAEKRQKLTRFFQQADSNRSLYGELLVRYVASQQLGIAAEDIVISANPYGKPYLEGIAGFEYNLSHSGCWVAMIYGHHAVGIDVERHRKLDIDSLARICLTSSERAHLGGYSGEEREQYFFQIWTCKESYIKAVGKGMSIPLDSFDVRVEGDRMCIKDQIDNCDGNYIVQSYDLENGYSLSACSASDDLPDELITLSYRDLPQIRMVL